MSSESINFPSATITSKLSASPTTKIPQATDWIFQDFFNTMLEYQSFNNDKALAIPDIFPYEKLSAIKQNHLFFDKEEDEELTAPILIESDISSEAPSSIMEEDVEYQHEIMLAESNMLVKRRSTSSFSSLKSFISVFHINKKHKQEDAGSSLNDIKYNTVPLQKKKNSIRSSITKKFAKLFKVSF